MDGHGGSSDREKRRENRMDDFKKGITGDTATEKRVDEHERLRRDKRERLLKRIRGRGGEQESDELSAERAASSAAADAVLLSEGSARRLLAELQSADHSLRLSALRTLRSVTASDHPSLAQLLALGIVPIAQKLLTGASHEDQFEVLWCLSNLASGSHDTTSPLYPLIPYIVNLLAPSNPQMADQAAWCLGNIAGDCRECREQVVRAGAVIPLMQLLQASAQVGPGVVTTAAFATCNLVRGGEHLPAFLQRGLLKTVLSFLTPDQPVEVLVEMAWVLTYATAKSVETKEQLFQLGGVELLVHMLGSGRDRVELMVPVLRCLGNLFNVPDQLLMNIVQTRNLLPYMWNQLSSPDVMILKEVVWAIRNLVGGPPQASLAIVNNSFVPILATLFNNSVVAVRKDVGAIFLSMSRALGKTTPFVEKLAKTPGVMSSFNEFINMPDVEMIDIGLRWAKIVLESGGRAVFEENGGLLALEDLEYNVHKTDELFDKANYLLDKYFSQIDEGYGDDGDVEM